MMAGERLTPEQQQRVESVLRFIHREVLRLAPSADNALREDLLQAGRLGASVAASRFRAGEGKRFLSYAAPYITGEIKDAMNGETRQSRIKARADRASRERLSELPEFETSALDPKEAFQLLQTEAHRQLAAMAAGVAGSAPRPDEAAEETEIRAIAAQSVEEAINLLGPRARSIFEAKYREQADNRTLEQIAASLDVSVSTARREHDHLLDTIAAVMHRRGVTGR